MLKKYRAKHADNRMKYEGDTLRARKIFFENPSNNLKLLLQGRYEWMNDYIKPQNIGIEVGCGMGVSKEFITNSNFKITDYADNEWLDVKNLDALDTGYKDNSFDFVISSNMVHHLYSPMKFFKEMDRILKPGGYLLIQEINASLMMCLVLRIMRHEAYDFTVDVFDEEIICNDPDDLWSANCAIPNLLFDDKSKFETHIPEFEMIYHRYKEFFCFFNSGGVIAKTFYIPLPKFCIKILQKVDFVLANLFPRFFALQKSLVLKKR